MRGSAVCRTSMAPMRSAHVPTFKPNHILLTQTSNANSISHIKRTQIKTPYRQVLPHGNVLAFAPASFNQHPHEDFDRKQLNKKLNLGKIVDQLHQQIPDILTTLISSDLISSDIVFRICPSTMDKIPVFKGYMLYVTTAKTLQLCLTQFILNPMVKVHISKTSVIDNTSGSVSGTSGAAPSTLNHYGLYKNTTKIILNWKTCLENCPHLFENEETARGSRGKHTWSKLDHSILETSQSYGLVNLKLTDDKIERILSGIFIFELNESNDKIEVMTVEDVEILENKEWIETTGSPAV